MFWEVTQVCTPPLPPSVCGQAAQPWREPRPRPALGFIHWQLSRPACPAALHESQALPQRGLQQGVVAQSSGLQESIQEEEGGQ